MKEIKRDIANECYIPMYESDLFAFALVQILQRVSECIDIVERSPGTDGIHIGRSLRYLRCDPCDTGDQLIDAL